MSPVYPLNQIGLPRPTAPFWLASGYLVIGCCWLLAGDSLAALLAGGHKVLYRYILTAEAVLFILLTSIFLYLISRKLYAGIIRSDHRSEQLRAKYMALNDAASEGFFDYSFPEKKAFVNAKMNYFLPDEGQEIHRFMARFSARLHPDDLERVTREYKDVAKHRSAVWKSEFRLLGANGSYSRLLSHAHILRDESTGKPLRLVGAIVDITNLRNLQTGYYEQKLQHKRALAASIIMAQEVERTRWAQELHDNVCQILSVANMYAIDIAEHPENVKILGPQLKKLLSESISEIRQLSAAIRTPAFDQETLAEAILKLSANINRLSPLNFIVVLDKFYEEALDNDRKLMIYRVVQEQVNNIVKYAEARSVQVSLDNTSTNQVQINVRDDGKGFDPERAMTGIGLKNIRSRLQVYNGRLEIQSTPGNGCTLEASFPM